MRGPHISAGKGRTCKLLQTQQTMGLKPVITFKKSMLDSRGTPNDSYRMGQDLSLLDNHRDSGYCLLISLFFLFFSFFLFLLNKKRRSPVWPHWPHATWWQWVIPRVPHNCYWGYHSIRSSLGAGTMISTIKPHPCVVVAIDL